jgi:thymidine phosphorylase
MDEYLPKAPLILPLPALTTGTVAGIKTRDVGLAVVQLGGGRLRADQKIDHAVGLTDILKIGETVEAGEPLCQVHVQTQAQYDDIKAMLLGAFDIQNGPAKAPAPVYETVK